MTPQQKKALSLKKDHRKPGENGKAIRKMAPAFKHRMNKAYRNSVHQKFLQAARTPDEVEALVSAIQRKSWRKDPDQPLGEIVKNKRTQRLWRALQPAARQDPTYLDRLEKRLLAGPIHPTEIRMVMSQVRSAMMAPHSVQLVIPQRMASEIAKIIPRMRPKAG